MISPKVLWESIRSRHTIVPRFAEIPAERVLTSSPSVGRIVPQQDYFAVVVDELFLSDSRKWLREFDPMVLAINEFIYRDKEIILPFIVGPKLLGDSAASVPKGMLYRGTRVAGVHPFRGGRVVSTIVLCQVQTADYSRRLLSFVESVAAAVPFAGELSTYTRYAGSLLDGVDALLGVGQTTPLVGIRQEFDHDLGTPIRPSHFVLVDGAEAKYPTERFWVGEEGLMIGDRKEELHSFREASYVLFSIRGAAELTSVDTLVPLHATAALLIDLAASPDEGDWKRAKAELVVLLRQVLSSPDLTREQALHYHKELVQQAQEAHERAKAIGMLSAAPKTQDEDALRRSTSLLDMP